MSGLTKNYKIYNEYLKTMPEPVMPSQLPKKKSIFLPSPDMLGKIIFV